MKNVCFTGHRLIKKSTIEILRPELYARLEALAEKGYTDFYSGGALGWDTLCGETVLALKSKLPNVRLHMILPCPSEQQTLKWKQPDIQRYNAILSRADSIEIVSPQYTSECMLKRNLRLAQLADLCICFFDESRASSGTGQTLRFMKNNSVPIENMFI
ncbi:MAG: DUF1273 family protein [Oscillospiraceae bacterium]|nr:DUF1273 family protein [Oscillospiraceae bacterium]